jgi:hypothetical protein
MKIVPSVLLATFLLFAQLARAESAAMRDLYDRGQFPELRAAYETADEGSLSSDDTYLYIKSFEVEGAHGKFIAAVESQPAQLEQMDDIRRRELELKVGDSWLALDKFPRASRAYRSYADAHPSADDAPRARRQALVSLHKEMAWITEEAKDAYNKNNMELYEDYQRQKAACLDSLVSSGSAYLAAGLIAPEDDGAVRRLICAARVLKGEETQLRQEAALARPLASRPVGRPRKTDSKCSGENHPKNSNSPAKGEIHSLNFGKWVR